MSDSNFTTSNITNLNSLNLSYIENFLGLSKTKVYTMLINNSFPYFKYQKVIRIFSENFDEFINQKKYTTLSDLLIIKTLPEIISANTVSIVLNISKSQTYKIMNQELYSMRLSKRILIKKDYFINWLHSNMNYST